jgi:hypothetical protein
LTVFFSLIVSSALLARRNVRLGRGDADGAKTVAAYMFLTAFIGRMLIADHVPVVEAEFLTFVKVSGSALFGAAFTWLFYMALEPFIRRRWPEILVGWTRALAGRIKDPLVGRDLLVGCALGIAGALARIVANAIPGWWNMPGWTPLPSGEWTLGPANRYVGAFILSAGDVVSCALLFALLLFLALLIARKRWLALLLTWIVFLVFFLLPENPLLAIPLAAVSSWIQLMAIRRGVLATAAAMVGFFVISYSAPTFSLSHWYSLRLLFPLVMYLALAVYGFRIALGGKPAFGGGLLDESD